MAVVKFETDKAFGEALYLLHYKVFGTFHVRTDRTLIVSDAQLKAIQNAGLVPTAKSQKIKSN